MSSLCDASEWSGGRYTGVFHFDAKARAVRYVRDMYPELAAKMSVVQVGSYLSNWQGNLGIWKVCISVPRQLEMGELELELGIGTDGKVFL